MSRDVEIEVDYDEGIVTIANESGVYEYDMRNDVMDTVDFLVEHGAGYSVYSQEEEEVIVIERGEEPEDSKALRNFMEEHNLTKTDIRKLLKGMK